MQPKTIIVKRETVPVSALVGKVGDSLILNAPSRIDLLSATLGNASLVDDVIEPINSHDQNQGTVDEIASVPQLYQVRNS